MIDPRTQYLLVKVMSDGLVVLSHPDYGDQIWSIVKVRKHKKCIILNIDLASKQAWSPIGNKNNRMDRISLEGMKRIKPV